MAGGRLGGAKSEYGTIATGPTIRVLRPGDGRCARGRWQDASSLRRKSLRRGHRGDRFARQTLCRHGKLAIRGVKPPPLQVTDDGTYTYQYDAEGNRIQQTDLATGAYTTYAYDFLQQLTTATSYTAAGVATQTVTYAYDAQGRRISETVAVAGGATTTTKFVYDGENIVATLDGTNALTNRYVDGPAVDQVFADEQFSPTSAGEMPSAPARRFGPWWTTRGRTATWWSIMRRRGKRRSSITSPTTASATSRAKRIPRSTTCSATPVSCKTSRRDWTKASRANTTPSTASGPNKTRSASRADKQI